MTTPPCRFCASPLRHTFVNLGMSPLANSYVKVADLEKPEIFYPLHVLVCEACLLVQLPPAVRPDEIFSDYAYFSSYSDTWVAHARAYVVDMMARFGFDGRSQVVEIASNDGYLLRHFHERGVPVLGVEPAVNVARVAAESGIRTEVAFFGQSLAERLLAESGPADLLLGNNVLAHVPDINDFVVGLKILLAADGVITMEFPHLLRLMEENQFDTIYHEHFSYLSFAVVRRIFARHGLTLFDVEELPTHGGSLRIYARHDHHSDHAVTARVGSLLDREELAGLGKIDSYGRFGALVQGTKRKLLSFLIDAAEQGKTVAGYGAPAKGNTLLNYCGVGTDLLAFTVDRSPHKQGSYLPGVRIPIHPPDRIRETRPDYVLILPWNLRDEVMEQMADVRSWGAKFVVAIPEVRVL